MVAAKLSHLSEEDQAFVALMVGEDARIAAIEPLFPEVRHRTALATMRALLLELTGAAILPNR